MSNYNLYHYCRRNCTDKVMNLLNKNKDIDVLYEEGIFFKFAISQKNMEICQSLLEYFENKQFTIKNNSYERAKEKLTEVLENVIDGIKISSEMQQVISPYIYFDYSLENRSNDSMLKTIDVIKTDDNLTKTIPIKRSYSTGDLSNNTNIFGSDSSINHSSDKKNNIIDDMFLYDKNHDFEIEKIEDINIIGEIQNAENL